MQISEGSHHWNLSISIQLWLFKPWAYFRTLQFNEDCSDLEGAEGTIYVIYQDQNTLQIASEYYLMNNRDEKTRKPIFYSMRRMFEANARIDCGCLEFEFNTYCGIDKNDLKQGVCFIEDGFIKIGLRN